MQAHITPMHSETHSKATLIHLRQWHRSRSKSNTRSSPSPSSRSSIDTSPPATPLDLTHLLPLYSPTSIDSSQTLLVEEYWNRKLSSETDTDSNSPSSRSSLEETRSQPADHDRSRPRQRTETVTPATVRRALQRDSDRMRVPFPGASQRDSGLSTETRSAHPDCDSVYAYNEELGGIPARHPLRNRVNSKGSSVLSSDSDSRLEPPMKSFSARAQTYRPDSSSSHSPSTLARTTASLRLKPKKPHSHRGAMTLFKALASSPNPDESYKTEDVEFDWAEQRRQELEKRSELVEESRRAAETDGEGEETTSTRPKSWEPTSEELVLRRDQEEEEKRRFVFKRHVWVNQSYVSAHSKDTVPYPLAYDTVNVQTDRHAHNLVKQLFYGRPSIHGDLPQRPPAFVLDLGCGDGTWLLEAAQCWKNTRFYGLDLQNLHPPCAHLVAELGEIADNISFTYYNFLLDKLPYLDEKFDLVRMANLKWAIPEDKWDFVLQEVHRVLRRGGWVEIIDDDFVVGTSPQHTLSLEQHITYDTLETQFIHMLEARNLRINTDSHFMDEKLRRWFGAFNEEDFPIAVSRARPVSVEIQGQSPVQFMLPSEGMSQKAAKLMGFGLDSSLEKPRPAPSTRSRSRSDSVSSGVSHSSGTSCSSSRNYEDRITGDAQSEHANEVDKGQPVQPLGLDVYPGRFIPFPPAELNAHAIRNMQSILASKEAIRHHTLTKHVELETLEAKGDLLPEERQRFDELSWEWNEQQNAFDDAFWDFETAMLQRLNLPQHSFDIDDDDDYHKSPNSTSRPQPLRTGGGLTRLHKNGDTSTLPSPVAGTFSSPSRVTVRHIRVYSGWK
ncbi:hypothetical protein K439DRAFT_1628472 [Ramaria rubella]|nr:hypothetical protein K439DRAFT_1628472 [Ramaria rubella]